MKITIILFIFLSSLTASGQIDSSKLKEQFSNKLADLKNYTKLSDYYCSDLAIDCGCNAKSFVVTSDKVIRQIDIECNNKIIYSYTFTLFPKSSRLEVYDNLSKRKLKNWNEIPSHP
jgi:hypothetical protein